MLSRLELPRTTHAESDSEHVSRQTLDHGLGATVSKIAVQQYDEAPGSLESSADVSSDEVTSYLDLPTDDRSDQETHLR